MNSEAVAVSAAADPAGKPAQVTNFARTNLGPAYFLIEPPVNTPGAWN